MQAYSDNFFSKKPPLQMFFPNIYYKKDIDPSILNKACNTIVQPKTAGCKLIANYYENKYYTNITFPKALSLSIYTSLHNFCVNINFFLQESRHISNNYRHAFVIGIDNVHSTPIVYICEDGEEGILFADSLGSRNFLDAGEYYQDLAREIIKCNIPVYFIPEDRQADAYSCYLDALIIAKDATAINQSGEYKIPHLLRSLKERSCLYNQFIITKLPDTLLKTCQKNSFFQYNKEENPQIIHKKETIQEFRDRYTDQKISIVQNNTVVKKDISNYLRKKAIKLGDIIEIEFYIEQLEERLGINDHTRAILINEAKKILNKNADSSIKSGELYEFFNQFANTYNEEDLLNKNLAITQKLQNYFCL